MRFQQRKWPSNRYSVKLGLKPGRSQEEILEFQVSSYPFSSGGRVLDLDVRIRAMKARSYGIHRANEEPLYVLVATEWGRYCHIDSLFLQQGCQLQNILSNY